MRSRAGIPRTFKEAVAAKRARTAEKEANLADHAADDSNREVEERRKEEAADAKWPAELHELLEEAERRLQNPETSQADRKGLEEERVRLLRLIKRARV